MKILTKDFNQSQNFKESFFLNGRDENPIDFLSGFFSYLKKKGIKGSEPLAKASGRKKKYNTLLDLTAGFGRDAFYFFCLGFQVRAIEKSKLIYSFLKKAYQEALKDKDLGPLIKENLHFIYGNSFNYLNCIGEEEKPDVIYLDPFFPKPLVKKKESALSPRWIQILKGIEESEAFKADEAGLLNLALKKAKHRVILKRPLRASFIEPLGFKKNYHSYKGKLVRYDTYFI